MLKNCSQVDKLTDSPMAPVKKYSRRQFLEVGMVTSVATRVGWANNRSVPTDEDPPRLTAAVDGIIPTDGDMPSASQAGCVQYIERLASNDSKVARQLQETMLALEDLSQHLFQRRFQLISRDRIKDILAELESQNEKLFRSFRDIVYEAYYQQPQIWERIGYRFYPTDGVGPTSTPFDAGILAEVRKRPSSYRLV